MFDLFRFVMLRPAVPREADEIISTEDESSLQQKLQSESTGPAPGPKMEQTANEFISSDRFVSSSKLLAFGEAYDELFALIRAKLPTDLTQLLREIKKAFDIAATDLVEDSGFMEDRKRLADSLIAAKIGVPPVGAPLHMLARNLRLIALIQRAAAHDVRLNEPAAIEAALDASIALPDGLLPLTTPEQPPAASGDGGTNDREKNREEALRQYRELSEAQIFLRELQPIHMADLDSAAPSQSPTKAPAPGHDPSDALFRELRELRAAVLARGSEAERAAGGTLATAVHVAAGANLMLKREVLEQASSTVRSALRSAGIDLTTTSVPIAFERINAKLTELTPQVAEDAFSGSNVSMVGGQFFPTSQVPDLNAVEGRG